MSILEWAKKEVALADQRDGTTASADRLADMDNTYSILNDKLIEYELTR